MDSFLQLDSGGGSNLVYDGDLVADEPAHLDITGQSHTGDTNQTDGLLGGQLHCPAEGDLKKDHTEPLTPESDDLKRQCYLQRLLAIEKKMKSEGNEMQQRIDMTKRILGLTDPMEQLSAYLTLRQESRQEDDVDTVEDLVHCAKRMTNEEDSEVAMLGACFFLGDRRRLPTTRGLGAMMPVVVAMMEQTTEVDRAPF